MDKILKGKLDKILKLNENVDVSPPPQEPIVVPPVYTGAPEQVSVQHQQENVAELINKQTEMIISVMKALIEHQEKVLSDVMETIKSSQVKNEFQEKVVSLHYDEKGNPISAEIKLKPFDENKLNLEELESRPIVDISNIRM